MISYPKVLLTLMELFKKLPGVGKKSAERFAFNILEWSSHDREKLASLLASLGDIVTACQECGCFKEGFVCAFCEQAPHSTLLCVVASPKDAYSIASTKIYQGHYHVIGSLLSPLEGKTVENLHLSSLEQRIQKLNIQEMIIAFDSTLEGDTTALYLHEHFKQLKVTRLALGLPVGSSLDLIDSGTLSQAFYGRQPLHTQV